MNLSEDIKRYLPQYLSGGSQAKLFAELKNFPDNIHKRLYSETFREESYILQGDGFSRMLVINLPDPNLREGPAMVLSNSCDVSIENKRALPPRLMYCPIIKLSKYTDLLKRENLIEGEALTSHLDAIKRQEISSFFFLPKYSTLSEDYIALLDSVNNCALDYLSPDIVRSTRVFSLSNYGFYLFLLKLSIHFTRIREAVDRQ